MIDTIELCGNTDDDSDKQPSGPASRFHANTQWDFIQATLTDNQWVSGALVGQILKYINLSLFEFKFYFSNVSFCPLESNLIWVSSMK